jgi:hypothetical protein
MLYMNIKSLDVESIIFLYATLSHGSLATLYTNHIHKINHENILYFLGHIIISIAMLFRIYPKYRGSVEDIILGIFGHMCLLCFFIIITFITTNNYPISIDNNWSNINWLNILCIIGQLGMIMIYTIEYLKYNKRDIYIKYEKYYKYIYIFTFTLLAYFYINIAFIKYNDLFYTLIMIFILYCIFLFKPINIVRNNNQKLDLLEYQI